MAGAPQVPRVKRGDAVTAKDRNAIAAFIEGAYKGNTGPSQFQSAEGTQTREAWSYPPVEITITGCDPDKPWRHSWIDQIHVQANSDALSNKGNAATRRESGDVDVLYFMSTNLFEGIPAGEKILAHPFFDADGDLVFIGEWNPQFFPAEITGGEATTCDGITYSFKEKEADGSGGLQDKAGGRTGTDTSQDLNEVICIPVGTLVWMRYSETIDKGGGGEEARYLFEYTPDLEQWVRIDCSSPPCSNPYTGTVMEPDGAGGLQATATVLTAVLNEVNAVTGIADGTIVRAYFSECVGGNKRFLFEFGTSGSGCTNVYSTVTGDVGSATPVGCANTLSFIGADGSTNCTNISTVVADGAPDTVSIIYEGTQFKDIILNLDGSTTGVGGASSIISDECDEELTLDFCKNGFDLTGDNGAGTKRVTIDLKRIVWQARVTVDNTGGSYTVQALTVDDMDDSDIGLVTAVEMCGAEGIRVGTRITVVSDCDVTAGSIFFIHERNRFVFKARVTAGGIGNNTYTIQPLKDDGTNDTAVYLPSAADEINAQEYLRELAFDSGGAGADPIVLCILEEIDCTIGPIAYFDMSLTNSWAEVTVNIGAGVYTVEILTSNITAITGNPVTTATEVNLKAGVPVGTKIRLFFEKGVWNAQDHFECSCQPVSSSDIIPS